MTQDVQAELAEAVDRVLASKAPKKLVVAGPGAGKTTLFKKLLEAAPGSADQRLVLTFINNLKADLDRSLGEIASVFTLHGYCQHLLRLHEPLRNGLTAEFRCYPGLVSLIKQDWEFLKGSAAPQFVKLMRDLACSDEQDEFYVRRANFYDAVDFDDSVYRVQAQLAADPTAVPAYELVLIDEFQDFNKMEAAVIDRLAEKSGIVIAGDDDQALYSELRAASWDHIRGRHGGGEYEVFELPFCMRCPEVVVSAIGDIIGAASKIGLLTGRIAKPFRYFEPVKGEDSRQFPTIQRIETSVQRTNANYFGRYIEQYIRSIPEAHFAAAAEKHEPAVLVIGPQPYRGQVEKHLAEVGLLNTAEVKKVNPRHEALEILSQDSTSNLGWRIILGEANKGTVQKCVIGAAEAGVPLADVVPEELRENTLAEAAAWAAAHEDEQGQEEENDTPSVLVTSFEGSKGLSAQYVFLLGLQSGVMPRSPTAIKDIEICRLLVGLTRTKRECSVLITRRFGERFMSASEFLSWINSNRYNRITVDAAYWRK